jgi:ketosteroid isomerase-like protein
LVNPLARQVLVIASALATVAVLSTCSRSDPERQVRSTIAAMAQAIEQHRVSDALEPLAEDFTRDSGAFGKQEARRVLAGAMLRNEKIQLSATVTEVRVEGERAFAKVRVIATGGAGLLPERGQTWEFDTAWRLEGGQWKVFNAEWREGL